MLIVEDNLEMQDFISKRLMDKYDVYRAADGLEALKVLKEFDIDIVVSDIMMPNMDGYELTRTLREADCDLPILMITAKDQFDDIRLGIPLRKPMTI